MICIEGLESRTLLSASVPQFDHIVVLMEENHSTADIYGSADAPFFNSLAAGGAEFTQSFGVRHPSEPNYLALFSGSTQGVTDDGTYTFSGSNLASELQDAGLSFTGYAESPSVREHDPWESFTSSASDGADFSQFPSDFSQLRTVSFVVPNLNDEMHNGTVAAADAWAQANIGAYAQWAKSNNSLLIVWWDEDDGTANNNIPTIFYGANVISGKYSETINDYNLLRTIEDAYQLPLMGNSAAASPITDVFQTSQTSPTLALSGASTANTGVNYTLTLSSSDSGDDAMNSWQITWGDGQNETVAAGTEAQVNGQWVTTSTATHAYAAPGKYTISATAADSTGAHAAGNTVGVRVVSEPTQLVFHQQPTNATAGRSISPAITACVEDAGGNIVTTDSSTVTLSLHSGPGALSGTLIVAAVNGMASFSDLSLDMAGAYTLQATDGSLTSATSGSFTIAPAAASQLVVNQQPTSATAGIAIAPAVSVNVEDQYGNLLTTDTSNVMLAVDTGPAPLSGRTTVAAVGGVATFGNLSLDTAGMYTLKATDGSLAPATSDSFTVIPAATTTTLAASSNPITAGQVVALIATVTSSSGSPAGTVTFVDGSTLIGTVTVNSTTHQAIGFTISLPEGSNDIMAIYNGADEFAASSASLNETVNPPAGATTTALAASSNPITIGQVVAFTATVTSSSGSPTGTVTFMDGSTLIGAVTLNSTTDQAIGYTASLPVGSNNITAIYNGTGGLAASSASLSETVNPAAAATTTTLTASSNPITTGQVVAFIATVTSNGGSPTGTVTFMDGSTLIGTAALNSTTHQAIGFTISLPEGSNDITAIYNGADGFTTSSASLSETVNAAVAVGTALLGRKDAALITDALSTRHVINHRRDGKQLREFPASETPDPLNFPHIAAPKDGGYPGLGRTITISP
ncbi:MAG: Ig-like domain repeat protein [Tepidisphaeraceae bacterium]